MNKVSPEFLSQLNYLRMVPSPSIALLFLGTRIMLPSEESVLCPEAEGFTDFSESCFPKIEADGFLHDIAFVPPRLFGKVIQFA